MTLIQLIKKVNSLVEQSAGMVGHHERYSMLSSGNSGHGVPDRDRFKERRADSWHPKHARHSGYQRHSGNHVGATATSAARAHELPTWYRVGIAVIATVALIVFMILFP